MLPKGIEDRDADCWEPPLTVADLGGRALAASRACRLCSPCAQTGEEHPTECIELLADIKAVFDQLQVKAIFTVDLLAELGNIDRRWRRLDGRGLARTLHSYGINETHLVQRIRAGSNVPPENSKTPDLVPAARLDRDQGRQTGVTTMSEDTELPTDIDRDVTGLLWRVCAVQGGDRGIVRSL